MDLKNLSKEEALARLKEAKEHLGLINDRYINR